MQRIKQTVRLYLLRRLAAHVILPTPIHILRIWITILSLAGLTPLQADVRLNVGDNFQTIVNANAAGTQYRIAAGVHRLQAVTPKSGDSFVGEDGAVMKGSQVLDPAAATQYGNLYYWSGNDFLNLPIFSYYPDTPRELKYCSELFVDGTRYRMQDTLAAVVAPNQWYYDSANGIVYMYGSPAGKTIELSKIYSAFVLTNLSDVRIENLTIQQYASAFRDVGAIRCIGSQRTVLRNLDVSYNHAAAAGPGSNTLIENCRFTYNGQIGAVGSTTDFAPITIRHTEFAYNHQLSYTYDECGGLKICLSHDGIFEHNWVHQNDGPGIWYDVYNAANIIRSNLLEKTDETTANQTTHIFYEISGTNTLAPTAICWNTINGNSVAKGEGGIVVNDSANVLVFENALTRPANTGIMAYRGTRVPGLSKFRAWGNDVVSSHMAQFVDWQCQPGDIELLDHNSYRGLNLFDKDGIFGNFTWWQGKGYDASSTYTSSTTTALLPQWAIPFEPSVYGPAPAGRTVYLRLDEPSGSTAFNSSVNGVDGTLSGGANFQSTGGIRNGALSFPQNGTTDYVSLGTTPGGTSALTVAFWMKPSVTGTAMTPISKFPTGTGGAGWAVKLNSIGQVSFLVGSSGNAGTFATVSTYPNTVSTNWMHVAATFSGSTSNLYINGVLQGTGLNITQTTAETATDLRLGALTSGSESFQGLLDDVQIYSTALTETQVRSLTGGIEAPKAIGHWSFDDGYGPIARDFASSGTGTLINNPQWSPGIRGYSLIFDGATNYVAIPSSTSLAVSGTALTTMAWIEPASTSGTASIISKGADWEMSVRDGRLWLELTLTSGSSMRVKTTDAELSAGQRYHLAAVRSGTSVALYINGASRPVTFLNTASSLGLQTSTLDVNIAQRTGGTQKFTGLIDEVRAYDTALSAGEIEIIMNQGQPRVTREVWTGIYGSTTDTIPVNTPPKALSFISTLEGPTNIGNDYGDRTRGYIIPETSGAYTFWIAGDNGCDLYLSTSADPAAKVLIANVVSSSGYPRTWNANASQKSTSITLTSGQPYYFEILHKEAAGGDCMAVGWAKPGEGTTAPSEVIPWWVLSPY